MRCEKMAVVVCLLLHGGCNPPTPKAIPATAAESSVAASSEVKQATRTSVLTEAQKNLFVESMLEVGNGGSSPNDFFDVDLFFAKVADIVEVPAKERTNFIAEAKRGYSRNSLGKNVGAEVAKGGSFTFLRFSQRDGYDTAIFRHISSASGLAYLEFAMPNSSTANFELAPDAFVYVNSEWFSQTSANFALEYKAAQDPSMLNKLLRGVGFTKGDSNKLKTLFELREKQDWRGVITTFNSLPDAMKQSKLCLINRFHAASRLRDELEISAAVEDLRKHCGNEPGIDLISFDYYLLRKEFGKAITALDRLERSVGSDPYVDVMRGVVFLTSGDFDQALAAARSAVDREPTLMAAYFLSAKAAQLKSDFATVAEIFKTLEGMGQVTPEAVAATPDYAPFVKSSEFKAWKAESEAKK